MGEKERVCGREKGKTVGGERVRVINQHSVGPREKEDVSVRMGEKRVVYGKRV